MFPKIMKQYGDTDEWYTSEDPDIEKWISLIKSCFSTGNDAIAEGQLVKMKRIIEMSDDKRWIAEKFFPAAMNALHEYAGLDPSELLKQYLSRFFQMAFQFHIGETLHKKGCGCNLRLVPLALH